MLDCAVPVQCGNLKLGAVQLAACIHIRLGGAAAYSGAVEQVCNAQHTC